MGTKHKIYTHNETRAGCRGRRGRRLAPLETQANIEALFLLRRNLPLRPDYLLLLLFWLRLRRMGAAVRDIMPQRRSQLLAVVGEDLRVVCAARNGNVGHAVVEQVFGPQLGIGLDQYPVGGLALAGMSRVHVIALPQPVIAAAKPLPAFFSLRFSHG
jgi:hypothetical protein